MTHQKTKTATIWTLSPGKRVATVSARLEDDRWIVYCGNVQISDEMRHRHNADKLAHETAYFEEAGRNNDTVITLTIGAIVPPPDSVLFDRTYG